MTDPSEKPPKNFKRYLGDAVYVDFDGTSIVLTTEDGIEATNRIWMDPEVVSALADYVEELEEVKR